MMAVIGLLVLIGLNFALAYVLGISHSNATFDIVTSAIVSPLVVACLLLIYKMRARIHDDERLRFVMSDDDVLRKYKWENHLVDPFGKRLAVSTCYMPQKKDIRIEEIKTSMNKGAYQLPNLIAQNVEKILPMSKKFYNSKTFRLDAINDSEEGLSLEFLTTNYFNHVLTNNSPDVLVAGHSVRELLEPGPRLSALSGASASNHLGMNLLVETRDSKLILQRRSKSVSFSKGLLAPTASGCLDDQALNENGEIDLKKMILLELYDESGLSESDIEEIVLLGISRELVRLGKPEIFFLSQAKLSESEVLQRYNDAPREESEELIFVKKGDIGALWESFSLPLKSAFSFFGLK